MNVHEVHLVVAAQIHGLGVDLPGLCFGMLCALSGLDGLELTEEVLKLLFLVCEFEVAADETACFVHKLLSVDLGVR